MIYIKGVLVFCILLSGCDYIKFAKGVKNESDIKFKQHKLYIKSIPILGEVLEKNVCTDCNYNRYRIKIKLSNFNADTVNISFRSYEPFYVINDQSITLSISKQIYDEIEVNAEITKKSNSNYIKFKNNSYRILSENENKWLE